MICIHHIIMMKLVPQVALRALFVLLFAFSSPSGLGASEASYDITGSWKNQRGSTITITAVNGYLFAGRYTSSVGNVSGSYLLYGQFDPSSAVISWNVNWHNSESNAHSMTGWIGQYFPSGAGEGESIYTNWLLTSQVGAQRDFWQGTRVGSDTFHRN